MCRPCVFFPVSLTVNTGHNVHRSITALGLVNLFAHRSYNVRRRLIDLGLLNLLTVDIG
ncbi:hypothetical protein HanXRQr2_Chr08g0359231 [Helianthus annuus]|uniref:Uncharacterized protein n=1 Tax=Helianthus annuus TaxID=4232 RepID=A0A9K3NDX9_HELAN|nr:hypothetical protein HanXRQr2_Chr08g0359231 [Helianthus annuus]